MSEVGSLFIPTDKDFKNADKEFKGAKFKNDEAKMLGEGSLALAIASDNRVSGTTEGGPIGKTNIEGRAKDGAITASVRRADPNDEGLTGTLTAKISGDKLDGTMKLAEANAAIVRDVKVSAERKK